MKTTILLLLMMFSFATRGASQQTCQLDLKDAPPFFNLKLGMTEVEVRAAYGKELKFKPKKKPGERTFFQNFISKPPPVALAGVRALYLRFFNHQIYQIEVFYENRTEWPTLTEFTRRLAVGNHFPNEFWTFKPGRATIKCLDFTLLADQVLNPRIELTDEATRAEILRSRTKHS